MKIKWTDPSYRTAPTRFRSAQLGVALLFPVILLALVGIYSLRNDRMLLQAETKDRAQWLARQVIVFMEDRLDWEQTNALHFVLSPEGDLLFPLPIPVVPEPQSRDLALLSAPQRELWARLNAHRLNGPSHVNVIEACDQFLASHPPLEFAVIAQYSRALAILESAGSADFTAAIDPLIHWPSNHCFESGLPVRAVAQAKWIEVISQESGPNSGQVMDRLGWICSNAVVQPHLFSDTILARAEALARNEPSAAAQLSGIQQWQRIWERHQQARELAGETWRQPSLQQGGAPIAFWDSDDRLVAELPAESSAPVPSRRFVVLSGKALQEAARETALSMPDFLGLEIRAGGRLIIDPGAEPVPAGAEILAARTSDSLPSLSAKVLLSNPAALMNRQLRRTFWLSALILVASGAAIFGWVTSSRSFRRQEQLHELKSNFVASVSHELRAPIASVRLMAEALCSGKVSGPEKTNQYFRFIVQECRRLSALIENVLDFSRIERRQKEYHLEPADLSALVNETVQMMQPYAADRGVNLIAALSSGLEVAPAPIIDARAIQQALVNLIDNAIKHSPDGASVVVGLRYSLNSLANPVPSPMAPRPAGAGFWALWVEDQGPGIPPEDHERIFEYFYRRGSELRRETQGVGIGLAIVKQIVDAHRGRVRVESAPGHGSRFVIELEKGEYEPSVDYRR